jgi:hypothetical protein
MSKKSTKPARAPKPYPVAKRHHLDRRADKIMAAAIDAADDDLLTTAQVADWFGISAEWLEIGRSKNYGPKFTRIGPHTIRYRRDDCRKFLKARTFASTAEYAA